MFSDPASGGRRKVNLDSLDMSQEEMKGGIKVGESLSVILLYQEWEQQEMEKCVDFTTIKYISRCIYL